MPSSDWKETVSSHTILWNQRELLIIDGCWYCLGESPRPPLLLAPLLHFFSVRYALSFWCFVEIIHVQFPPPVLTMPLHTSWNTQSHSQRYRSPSNSIQVALANCLMTEQLHLFIWRPYVNEEHYHTDIAPPFPTASDGWWINEGTISQKGYKRVSYCNCTI